MKALIFTGLLFISLCLNAQESQMEWTDARFVLNSFKPDLVPFDSEKRIFINETVYVEEEFERTHKPGKMYSETQSNIAGVAAYGIVCGLFFLMGKGIESAVAPKEKYRRVDKNDLDDEENRGKGIRR